MQNSSIKKPKKIIVKIYKNKIILWLLCQYNLARKYNIIGENCLATLQSVKAHYEGEKQMQDYIFNANCFSKEGKAE